MSAVALAKAELPDTRRSLADMLSTDATARWAA
jgi:hypothetical protein